MRTSKRVLLLGPGESSSRFNTGDLGKITTISFSGNIDWLAENNVHTDYWTFFDPNSTLYVLNNIESGKYPKEWINKLKKNTTLLCNKFIGTDDFYDNGFTTSRGSQWNREVFGEQILPKLSNDIFAGIEKVDQQVNQNTYDSYYKDPSKCPLVVHTGFDPQGRKLNTDKFICFILPLVLTHFTELREIYSVGFGDYDDVRINTGTKEGYESFKISYNMMKEKTKDLLKHRGVSIKFINKDSYFKELE